MQRQESGNEGLTAWQLVNELYVYIEIETRSIIGLVSTLSECSGSDKIVRLASARMSFSKVENIILYLKSILDGESDFSINMSRLYDWYEVNVRKVLDSEGSGVDFLEPAKNAQTQASKFIEVWSQLERL